MTCVERSRDASVRPASLHMMRSFPLLTLLTVLLVLTGCSNTMTATQPGAEPSSDVINGQGSLTQIPPAERKAAAIAAGERLGGGQVSASDYPGKIIVLNVWGSWCAPCRKEAKDLEAAFQATKDVAQFVGVNIRDNNPAQAEAFVRTFGVSYPHIYDPPGNVLLRFAGDLPPSAIPSTLVIDAQGRLAVRIIGPISERTLITVIEDVAAGR